jgi:hypothetical protein
LGKAQLQGANLYWAQLQGADLREVQLQGAILCSAQLQGAILDKALLQGTSLMGTALHGAYLREAQLQGTSLLAAKIGSTDFFQADLTWSDLRGVDLSPLDEEIYEHLKQELTDAISDERRRTDVLKRIQAAVGQPTNLKPVFSPSQVMCDDVNLLPSCLTEEKLGDYADGCAAFLVELGCQDATIARGVVSLYMLPPSQPCLWDDSILRALAKHVTAIPEQECPGWAALRADQKDLLRQWAEGKPAAP